MKWTIQGSSLLYLLFSVLAIYSAKNFYASYANAYVCEEASWKTKSRGFSWHFIFPCKHVADFNIFLLCLIMQIYH